MTARHRLSDILSTMIVPSIKMDLSVFHHVEWLGRNLYFHNLKHPDFPEACSLLHEILSESVTEPLVVGHERPTAAVNGVS